MLRRPGETIDPALCSGMKMTVTAKAALWQDRRREDHCFVLLVFRILCDRPLSRFFTKRSLYSLANFMHGNILSRFLAALLTMLLPLHIHRLFLWPSWGCRAEPFPVYCYESRQGSDHSVTAPPEAAPSQSPKRSWASKFPTLLEQSTSL